MFDAKQFVKALGLDQNTAEQVGEKIREQESLRLRQEFLRKVRQGQGLFLNRSPVLLSVVLDNICSTTLVITDRFGASPESIFYVPLYLHQSSFVCLTDACPNYHLVYALASMLTFVGIEVYTFGSQIKTISRLPENSEDITPEVFDPADPPGMIFILTMEIYQSLFGFKPDL